MFARWIDWVGQSLGRRIAVQSIAGGLVASLLLAVLAFAGTVWLLHQEQEKDAQQRLEQAAERLTGKITVFARSVADLAANTVMTTALLDSRERDTYLKPFLSNHRLPLTEPHGITLCDFEAKPLAASKQFPPHCFGNSPLMAAFLLNEQRQTTVIDLDGRPQALTLQPVLFPGTGLAEGFVAATLDLREVLDSVAHDGGNVRLRLLHDKAGLDIAAGGAPASAASVYAIDGAFGFPNSEFRLMLEESRTLPDGLGPVAAAYGAGVLIAMLLDLWLARRMARSLTTSLVVLSRTAERIAREGPDRAPVAIVGRDEVARLADAFNRMLASLNRAREGLEEQVAKRTEALRDALGKVEDSERRYRVLFSRSKVAMLLVDPVDGAIIDANDAAAEYYGYEISHLKTLAVGALNTLTAEEVAREMRLATDEKRSHFHFRHQLGNGEIRDVEVHSGPIELDGRQLLYSIIHDVTDRRRLDEERRRLFLAVEHCPVSVIITNAEGGIEYVNPAFKAITGYSIDEVRGQTPRLLKSGETPDHDYRAMWKTLTSGGVWSGIFHNKRKDGSLYWEQAHISPVIDIDGTITHFVAVKENITERREAEQAIRDLSSRLQDVLTAASEVAIIATDLNGVITLFNTGAQRMLGYSAEEVVGRQTPTLFHTTDEIAARERDMSAAAGRPVRGFRVLVEATDTVGWERCEWTYVRKDGGQLVVSLVVTPVRSECGAVIGYLGVAQDMTDRKRTEAALVASEERFRSLIEATTDWVWETDGEHRFTWFSASFDRVLGAPALPLLGKRRENLVAEDHEIDAATWRRHMEDQVARRTFRDFRYWLRTADGDAKWISISGSPRFDPEGRFAGYRGTGSDITKRAEASMRLQLLAQVVEQSPVSVVITDTQGRIEYVNKHLSAVSGWSQAELVGQGCGVFASGETPGDIYRTLWRSIRSGQNWAGELKNRKKDGSVHWESVVVSPVIGEEGEVVRFVGIKEDVTYRKEAEASIAEANLLLAEQAEQLLRSNKELEQFAYVASHDLRQPLRAVTSYLTLIERELAGKLDDELKEFFGFALGGAKRMDTLIVDLLEYSRIGRKERPFESVSLAEVVADSLGDLEIAVRESGAKVSVADGLPRLQGDPVELTRLFQNLIGNAVKYRPPERVPKVALGWRDDGGDWVVWVRDNGIGIAPKDYERVFGIFQRLVGREQYEGTGIGLAVCRKIVEHHKGRIWIEPAPDHGSVFLIAFPKPGRPDQN